MHDFLHYTFRIMYLNNKSVNSETFWLIYQIRKQTNKSHSNLFETSIFLKPWCEYTILNKAKKSSEILVKQREISIF